MVYADVVPIVHNNRPALHQCLRWKPYRKTHDQRTSFDWQACSSSLWKWAMATPAIAWLLIIDNLWWTNIAIENGHL